MINLLPASERRQLKAAHANTLLVRYVIITAVVIGLLLGAVGIVYQLLTAQAATAERHIAENQSKTVDFQAVQTQADGLRSTLSAAKSAFDGDIHYSKALLNIASAVPSDIAIKSLSLDAQSFNQQITLETTVNSEAQAYAIRTALEKSEFVAPGSVKFGKLIAPSDSNAGYTLEILVTFKKEIAQ